MRSLFKSKIKYIIDSLISGKTYVRLNFTHQTDRIIDFLQKLRCHNYFKAHADTSNLIQAHAGKSEKK
jgi:hypothetical protein